MGGAGENGMLIPRNRHGSVWITSFFKIYLRQYRVRVVTGPRPRGFPSLSFLFFSFCLLAVIHPFEQGGLAVTVGLGVFLLETGPVPYGFSPLKKTIPHRRVLWFLQ